MITETDRLKDQVTELLLALESALYELKKIDYNGPCYQQQATHMQDECFCPFCVYRYGSYSVYKARQEWPDLFKWASNLDLSRFHERKTPNEMRRL